MYDIYTFTLSLEEMQQKAEEI